MIIAIDVGNTNIEFGIFNDKKNDFNLIDSFRYFTKKDYTFDELGIFCYNFLSLKGIRLTEITKISYSSVVPQINDKIERMAKKYFNKNPFKIDSSVNIGIKNLYKNPKEVGIDRLINAGYIWSQYKRNAIIVDMGTATTFCVITEGGSYLGGVIMPGILTSKNALTDKASKLPPIEIVKKDRVLSDNTIEAIQSGIYYSNLFAIKGIIDSLAKEYEFKNCLKVGTGGYINIYDDEEIFDITDDELSMKGIKYLTDINDDRFE